MEARDTRRQALELGSRQVRRGIRGSQGRQCGTESAPALKWAGRASNALSFAVSAHEQWEKDSHNPSIGEEEKVTRAGL